MRIETVSKFRRLADRTFVPQSVQTPDECWRMYEKEGREVSEMQFCATQVETSTLCLSNDSFHNRQKEIVLPGKFASSRLRRANFLRGGLASKFWINNTRQNKVMANMIFPNYKTLYGTTTVMSRNACNGENGETGEKSSASFSPMCAFPGISQS